MWISFNKYLYCFRFLVGNPQMQRADCMHCSIPFCTGDLASTNFGVQWGRGRGWCPETDFIWCPGTTVFRESKVIHRFSVQGAVSLAPTLYVYPPDLSGLDPSVRLCLEVLFKIITDKVSVFKQISCIFVFSGTFSSTTWQCLNMGPKEPWTNIPLKREHLLFFTVFLFLIFIFNRSLYSLLFCISLKCTA